MSDLTAVRATWGFLQTLHPLFLFADTLPSVDAAEGHLSAAAAGECQQDESPATADDVEDLKNIITRLRTGLKLNIVKTQFVDIYDLDEDEAPEGFEDLEEELHVVLHELERLVDPQVLELELKTPLNPEGPSALEAFPKLVALHAHLRESEETGSSVEDTRPKPFDDLESMQTISKLSQRYSAASIAQAASLIRYPQDAPAIEALGKTVSRFGKVVERVLGDLADFWKMETQTLEYTPADVATIEDAHTFASVSTSLFGHMAEGCKRCETPHRAKLHLSGFKEDSLRISISTCEESNWVSAVFRSSSQKPSHEPTPFEFLCKPAEIAAEPARVDVQHIVFNSTGMWSVQQALRAEQQSPVPSSIEHALDQLLADRDRLTPKYRKLAEVLLAACIFQLNESPWTEQYLRPDFLYVPPLDKKRLHTWCPRLLCDLVPQEIGSSQQSDNIAAFGVLVLELEAHRQAAWTSEDEDWLSGTPSNSIRLARVLKDWEDSVGDDYRRVAKACLEFESLIQKLDHPDIAAEKRALAVIYKCILDPLFRHMSTTFQDLTPLFKDMFGPTRGLTAAMDITVDSTAKRELFDDDSMSRPEDRQSAAKFLADLKPFFSRVKGLWEHSSRLHFPTHDKVRIAVLDSGVSEANDNIIWGAITCGRISSKSKSFVGRPGDWMTDSHGHGTHVTRLLLEAAPAAEIYVAKICTGKLINNECLPGIAAAINWAVDEVDAHIISMSFGFEDEHDEIEAALDDALDAGKLIIAAASNNGGLSGRARPARQDGVICMHATDGKGNKGGMNPSPLARDDNFATLGVAVPLKWDGENVWKSGTSFAVPLAVGFAASVMELAKYRCAIKPRKLKLLYKKQGMAAVFKAMAEERDGYDFIFPDRLAKDWNDEKSVAAAAKTIESILTEL